MYPNCRSDKPDNDEDDEDRDKEFNPYQLAGSVCSHFGLTWKEVTKKLSYQDLLFLIASIPKIKTKEEREEEKKSKPMHFNDVLGALS